MCVNTITVPRVWGITLQYNTIYLHFIVEQNTWVHNQFLLFSDKIKKEIPFYGLHIQTPVNNFQRKYSLKNSFTVNAKSIKQFINLEDVNISLKVCLPISKPCTHFSA